MVRKSATDEHRAVLRAAAEAAAADNGFDRLDSLGEGIAPEVVRSDRQLRLFVVDVVVSADETVANNAAVDRIERQVADVGRLLAGRIYRAAFVGVMTDDEREAYQWGTLLDGLCMKHGVPGERDSEVFRVDHKAWLAIR